jgi:hypothetical protein
MVGHVRRFIRLGALAMMTFCVFAIFSGTAFATDPITLPSIGVDTSGTATAVGSAVGAIVQVCLTIGGAFLVVKIGWRWLRRMAG